jgi:hypothetical protein
MISKAKATSIVSNIIDGPLLDQEGKQVQLLSIFPINKKYILLDSGPLDAVLTVAKSLI